MKTLKEIKEKLEDIRGGGVKELNSYTEYNNLFFIENYNQIFDYIEDIKIKWGISLHSIESVFEQVIKDFSKLAIDFIEENITNEKDTENINILIDYVKNKYIYFGNFDKKIIKEFVNKLLEKEIII